MNKAKEVERLLLGLSNALAWPSTSFSISYSGISLIFLFKVSASASTWTQKASMSSIDRLNRAVAESHHCGPVHVIGTDWTIAGLAGDCTELRVSLERRADLSALSDKMWPDPLSAFRKKTWAFHFWEKSRSRSSSSRHLYVTPSWCSAVFLSNCLSSMIASCLVACRSRARERHLLMVPASWPSVERQGGVSSYCCREKKIWSNS